MVGERASRGDDHWSADETLFWKDLEERAKKTGGREHKKRDERSFPFEKQSIRPSSVSEETWAQDLQQCIEDLRARGIDPDTPGE